MSDQNNIMMSIRRIKEYMCRNMIMQIIVIMCVIIGLGIIIGQKNGAEKEIKMHQALWIFTKIDDIAHEQFAEMQATGNPHGFT